MLSEGGQYQRQKGCLFPLNLPYIPSPLFSCHTFPPNLLYNLSIGPVSTCPASILGDFALFPTNVKYPSPSKNPAIQPISAIGIMSLSFSICLLSCIPIITPNPSFVNINLTHLDILLHSYHNNGGGLFCMGFLWKIWLIGLAVNPTRCIQQRKRPHLSHIGIGRASRLLHRQA